MANLSVQLESWCDLKCVFKCHYEMKGREEKLLLLFGLIAFCLYWISIAAEAEKFEA